MRSSARASAVARLSRQLAVRFCGRSGVVSRVRLASAIRFRKATSEAVDRHTSMLGLIDVKCNW